MSSLPIVAIGPSARKTSGDLWISAMMTIPILLIPELHQKSSGTEHRASPAEPACRGSYARYPAQRQTGRFELDCPEGMLAMESPGHETPAGNNHTCWGRHRQPPPRIPTDRM